MLDQISRMLLALWSNDFSRLFSVLIAGYFLFALLQINTHNPKLRALVSSAPGAMTSLGILGTFIGIFLGLLDFDIRTINSSVPKLLEGLKVAFGTSILGLLGAVTFRIISPIIVREKTSSEDASAQDVVDQLMHLDTSVNKATEVNSTGFEELRNALTDDKDSSIVGQLQRLRTNVGDLESATRHGFEAQIKEFKDFAKHMSEAFSKAIIEELQSVIREFNETLTEQFGENFKQLNTAVGRLVDWQEEYRQQMSELKLALDNAVEGIKESEKSLVGIEGAASKIPDHVSRMEGANEVLTSQLEKIESSLGGFAEMRDKAINALPEIEKNIDDITSNLSATVEHQTGVVREIATNCESLISLQRDSNEQLRDGFEELKNTTSDTAKTLQSDVDQISKKLTSELSGAGEQLRANVLSMSEELTTTVNNTSTGITEHLKSSIDDQQITQQEMLEGVQSTFENTISSLQEDMDQISKKLTSEVSEAGKQLNADVISVSKELTATLTKSSADIANHIESAMVDQKSTQREMLEGLQSSFNETISNSTNRMNDAIVQLDEAMQSEIESVIRAMAENLSGITEKFVSDYTPLLETTRRVVELGERASRDE
jgi:chromosome segregation ATPase